MSDLAGIADIVAEAESSGRDTIEYNITRFAQILRLLGVRVSLAETMDALAALTKIDLLGREQVRGVLRACLAKSKKEAVIFEQAFNLFFSAPEEKERRRQCRREQQEQRNRQIAGAEKELMQVMEEWQQELPEKIVLTDQQLETFSLLSESEKERMKEILERMKKNPVNNPGELINRVLQSSLNYWRYHMMKNELERGGCPSDTDTVITGDEVMDEVIQNVTAQFYHDPADSILHRDMESLEDRDLPRITSIINRLAARLALSLSRRYKQSSRAVAVDIRRTVRRNMRFGGIPLELCYRARRRKRPQLILICDVSASMARYARFVIQFIYGLGSALDSMESFIFSEDLERVTQYFSQRGSFTVSMANLVNGSSQWGKSTNLFVSLTSFERRYRNTLSPETIVFVVSDGRTVAPEAAAGLLRSIKKRCGDIIWLNTMPRSDWQSHPQVKMFRALLEMYECNTLFQMEKALRRHVLKRA